MTQSTYAERIPATQTLSTSEDRSGFWRNVAVAGVVSLAANISIFLIANGVMATPIQAQAADGTTADLPFATIPIASIVGVILGMAFLALAKRYNRVTPALIIIGVVGMLSAFGPAGVDVITSGAYALVPMHITTTAAVLGTYVVRSS